MNKYHRFLFVFPLVAACAVQAGAHDDVQPDVQPQVLAEVRLAGEHRITFTEVMPGEVTLSETGFEAAAAARLPKLANLNLAEKYQSLVSAADAATVERLNQAQARVDALNAELSELEKQGLGPAVEPPISTSAPTDVARAQQAVTSVVQAQSPFTDANIFAEQWCDEMGSQVCSLNAAIYDSGFPGDVTFFSSFIVNLGPGSVTHEHKHYLCNRTFAGICVSRSWQVRTTQSVPAGGSGYFSDTYKWTRYDAAIPFPAHIHAAAQWSQ